MNPAGNEQRGRGCVSYLLIVAAVVLALSLAPAACVALFDKAERSASVNYRTAPAVGASQAP